MKVTMLGTGAPIHPRRNTLGMLIEAEHCEPLLIDTCGGFEVTRALSDLGYDRSSSKRIGNVVVTHRHGDHIGGAPALMLAFDKLRFYGHVDTLQGVKALMLELYPHVQEILGRQVGFEVVEEGAAVTIGGFEVQFFLVSHRVPTYAVRVTTQGKTFAFSADTVACPGVLACAHEADLFLCDALCAESDGYTEETRRLMHPLARDAAQFALKAKAKRLALTHIGRIGTVEAMLLEAKEVFAGEVVIPEDGEVLEV